MAVRTQKQADADAFDMRLFALIDRAERFAAENPVPVNRVNPWAQVVMLLRLARPLVRGMMSDADRRDTA